ncbi:deubiquitinating enzyme [Polyrhizophydium stewartii]|uniref:ubiquitinyl hydrolase 1 n=1 Tax=Polyrhizophydium stewartii TaxID=2732419 RepID=A0ABR4N220_9FUNG
MVQISVKWSGQKYPVDVDAAQTGLVLKTQLFSLTGVAPDRQKIMVKGGMLKDETPLASLGLKDGQQLMMMGTAGELPKAPEKPVVFMEDMTDAQIAQAVRPAKLGSAMPA